MQYISCYKCNRHGKTSEPCTCDEDAQMIDKYEWCRHGMPLSRTCDDCLSELVISGPTPDHPSALIGLLDCPFCGEPPELPDGDGTQYEIECHCGMAISSVQISDLMTIDERVSDDFVDYRYGEEFVLRARDEAVKAWNKRAI